MKGNYGIKKLYGGTGRGYGGGGRICPFRSMLRISGYICFNTANMFVQRT